MILHTFLSLKMSFLSQKVPIFDIWIYLYYGFSLRKKETGGDSLFILDRVVSIWLCRKRGRKQKTVSLSLGF